MKKWFIGMLVVCSALLMVVGPAAAEDAGPFHILHKQGAIYNSNTGWNINTPPYYAGSDWAVDFTYTSEGVSILHQDGAIWNATTGWNMASPPYYAGSGYARAIEYVRDLTGCWGLQLTEFETDYNETVGDYVLERDLCEYPYSYIVIEWQNGTRFGGAIVHYDVEDGCESINFEGTIVGDHFYAVAHNIEGDPGDECEVLDTLSGLVFWDDVDECWMLKGSYVGADLECDLGGEAAFFGAFIAWPETTCECPPPD